VMLLLIIILLLLFGGGGGYYGYSRWGPRGGRGDRRDGRSYRNDLVLVRRVALMFFGIDLKSGKDFLQIHRRQNALREDSQTESKEAIHVANH
jgi:hypothetical protein